MIVLVIPTFNRSAKLARVIEAYAHNRELKVVVLDASNESSHQAANKRLAKEHFGFVEYIVSTEMNLIKRLLVFLESIDNELITIANDEDIFFPEFLFSAYQFLQENKDYVVASGRYITSARPLLGLRRISYWTDSFLGMDINDNEPSVRIINFQRLNSGGVPPIYWGVHRRSVFIESNKLSLRLQYSGAAELMNQITSCVRGKICIFEQPMLLRDETRQNYIPDANRDEGKLYIGEQDLDEVIEIASDQWGSEIVVAVKAVTSWYRPHANGESYQTRGHDRTYCRLKFLPDAQKDRWLRWTQKIINWSCISGHLISQYFAFVYYYRYMKIKGKGKLFLKATETISVNK